MRVDNECLVRWLSCVCKRETENMPAFDDQEVQGFVCLGRAALMVKIYVSKVPVPCALAALVPLAEPRDYKNNHSICNNLH